MSLFQTTDYLKVLRDKIETGRTRRGYMTQLARAIHCHPSFLSQVLAEQAQLTPDHAAGLAEFWALPELESEYFLQLVLLARAGSKALRTQIQKRMGVIRKSAQEISAYVAPSSRLADEQALLYYSNWLYSALHMLVSVPSLATTPAAAARLQVAPEQALHILRDLQAMNLVRPEEGGRWAVTQGQVNIPRTSPLVTHHHLNWRSRAMDRIQNASIDDVHFTGVFSLSDADATRIRQTILDAIGRVAEIVTPSPNETAVHLGIDLFRLGG